MRDSYTISGNEEKYCSKNSSADGERGLRTTKTTDLITAKVPITYLETLSGQLIRKFMWILGINEGRDTI